MFLSHTLCWWCIVYIEECPSSVVCVPLSHPVLVVYSVYRGVSQFSCLCSSLTPCPTVTLLSVCHPGGEPVYERRLREDSGQPSVQHGPQSRPVHRLLPVRLRGVPRQPQNPTRQSDVGFLRQGCSSQQPTITEGRNEYSDHLGTTSYYR